MTSKPSTIRYQRTHDMILTTARQMIVDGGVDALSMRTLANAIDYSPSALYKYFDSKDALLRAIALQGLQELVYALREATLASGDFVTKVMATGQTYLNFAHENPQIYKLMFDDPTPFPPTETNDDILAELHAQAQTRHVKNDDAFLVMVGLFAEGIELGILQAHDTYDAVVMAFHAWVTVHGLAMLRMTRGAMLPDYEAVAYRILYALIGGMLK
jgi:AcrR family transcriptional regulator